MEQHEKERLQKLMEQYLQGGEHPEAEARFDAWFREVKPDADLQLSQEEVQQAIDRVRNRLHAETATGKTVQLSRRRLYAISAAAAVLVMMGLSAFWANSPVYNVLHPIKETMVFTRAGESKLVSMPDGSRIHLNENSILTYTNRFSIASREIALQGEAFFEVAKDARHPFKVRAGNAAVTVLGTSFNVSENKSDSSVMVAVKEGLIALQGNHTEKMLLTAGKAALAPRSGDLIACPEANVDNYFSWMAGDLHFDGTPLREVALELQQIYHVPIRLDGAALAGIHLTLQYKHAPLTAVLDVICNSLELQYVNVKGTIILQAMQE